MRRIDKHLRSLVFVAGVLFLSVATFAQATKISPSVVSQQTADRAQTFSVPAASVSSELPDSPGTLWAMSREVANSQDGPQETTNQPTQQQSAAPERQSPQRPVGTAAAEGPKVTGITAAEPAGVAIAPGKQRRVRTIVLKVGAIVGAGAALGTVIALSAGTSSKPPGAH